MFILIVEVQTGRGPREGEVINADPGKDLGVCPGVGIGPVMQLLIYPGEKADGAGGKAVGEGQRSCGLESVKGIAFISELLATLKADYFRVGQRRGLDSGVECWVICSCWFCWAGIVDVMGFAVEWAVFGSDDSCDGRAYVSALDN